MIYVMPNLSPAPDHWSSVEDENSHTNLFWKGVSLESDTVAIVSMHDARVQEAIARDPNVGRLFDAFVDTSLKKLHPSVLIVREDSAFTREGEGLVAFRNCVALGVVLHSRAAWAKGRDHIAGGWSDYFDFHPLQPRANGLISDSPAQLAILTERATHQAMPSPYVSATTVRTLFPDRFLRFTLGAEWRRYYENPTERTKYGRALFRSLEIAYMASASPIKNGGSVYEWGVQLALWVSAIEVLVSALNGRANQWLALDLLGEYDWGVYRPSLRNLDRTILLGRENLKTRHAGRTKRAIPGLILHAVQFLRRLGLPRAGERKARQVNVIQDACHLLYNARHKFLHGDKVGEKVLWPWGREERADGEQPASIATVAPVVYRIALHAFLSRKHKPNYESMADEEADALALSSVFSEFDYAEALTAIYQLPDEHAEGGERDAENSGDLPSEDA